MRRMISDKQLNSLISGAGKLKIIELDTGISQATITQEQMDIFFPKDAQGNIYKPDYYIVIIDTNQGATGKPASHGFAYLGFWNPTSIRFNRLGTNSYYTWTIGPNNTKFTQTRTKIPTNIAQHTLYIKTNDMYFYTTAITSYTNAIDPKWDFANACYDKYLQASGWLTAANAYITGVTYRSNENKFYVSTSDSKDYAFFESNDISNESFDSVTEINF